MIKVVSILVLRVGFVGIVGKSSFDVQSYSVSRNSLGRPYSRRRGFAWANGQRRLGAKEVRSTFELLTDFVSSTSMTTISIRVALVVDVISSVDKKGCETKKGNNMVDSPSHRRYIRALPVFVGVGQWASYRPSSIAQLAKALA
jgi:hypothetical protein